MTEPAGAASEARWMPTVVRIRVSSMLLVAFAVIAAIVIRGVFVSAHRAIGWAFATVVMAALLLPLVDHLARHLPRSLALTLVALGLVVVSAGLWAGVRSTAVREAEHLKVRAPVAAAALEKKYSWAKKADVTGRVDSLVAHIQGPSTGQKTSRAAGKASAYFVPLILMLFIMVYGPKMVTGGLEQLPEQRRDGASRLLSATVHDARIQILVTVAQACVVGLVIGGLSAAAGIEAPFLIGFIAGFLGMIPAVGIMLGSLPAILLATALAGPRQGLVVLIAAVTLQVVQVAVVRPAMSRSVGEVGPALAVITTLLAYELYGFGGAFYAFIGLIFVMALVRRVGMAHDSGAPA